MKYFFWAFAFIGITLPFFIGCESESRKGERLAHQYCASCHLFPDPSLLDKKNWKEGVLPQMAFQMGFFDAKIISKFSQDDLDIFIKSLPPKPMVSEADWQLIQNYYLTNAPDSLPAIQKLTYDSLKSFNVRELKLPFRGSPLVTMIKADTFQHKIYVGSRHSKLYELNSALQLQDSFLLGSPPSHIQFEKGQLPVLSAMGIMDPNDQSRGSLQTLSVRDHSVHSFIDSLKRPVHFERADLNGDQIDDYVICTFGNFTGALVAYEGLPNGKFKKHNLFNLPGSRRVIIKDFTNDGLKDILVLITQGDEQISLLTNAGNFNFRITTLLRFPPIYGSSYFDVADFNKDGKFDILLANGDNADFSITLKPYHGLRLFLNDGKNVFKESTFLPMSGASQAIARDFDKDGDIDIAAVAFFPDFQRTIEGFIYFENNGNGFTPQITSHATSGRWMLVESIDYDGDGDDDILLGALDFYNEVPPSVLNYWKEKKAALLILTNTLH